MESAPKRMPTRYWARHSTTHSPTSSDSTTTDRGTCCTTSPHAKAITSSGPRPTAPRAIRCRIWIRSSVDTPRQGAAGPTEPACALQSCPKLSVPKVQVAVVAPSLGILGGQAVQADRLLRLWRDDPDVHAWLVPINPELPRGLRLARNIKYVSTIITELAYALLLSTRNFEPLYNVACTLRAFRLVQDRRPDAALTLVGGGSEDAALRALVRELNLRNVTFAGRISPDAIADCYARHDIYIQSPNIDNMPTSVLEAYASGLPVVSTDAGGVPAMRTHGEHGLLAPPNDHRTLAAHVLSLLDDPALARRVVCGAHSACLECTWPRVRQQWLRLYQSTLPSSAGHPAPAVTGRDQ